MAGWQDLQLFFELLLCGSWQAMQLRPSWTPRGVRSPPVPASWRAFGGWHWTQFHITGSWRFYPVVPLPTRLTVVIVWWGQKPFHDGHRIPRQNQYPVYDKKSNWVRHNRAFYVVSPPDKSDDRLCREWRALFLMFNPACSDLKPFPDKIFPLSDENLQELVRFRSLSVRKWQEFSGIRLESAKSGCKWK